MNTQLIQEITEALPKEMQGKVEELIMDTIMGRMVDERAEKVERFRHLNKMAKKHQILFVGSSLMEQFPIYELKQNYDLPYIIYNRGIGGYTTTDLLKVMDVCIYDLEPDHIYINIGTNDLNGPDYSQDALIERYRAILKGIKEHLPDTRLNLLAYYPVCPSVGEKNPWMKNVLQYRNNTRITKANQAVAQLAEEFGARFIDLNAGITDENGDLKAEYTIEGMHMYGDGYEPVLRALIPYLP